MLFLIGLLEVVCIIDFPIGLVWLIISFIRKKDKKIPICIMSISLILLILLVIISGTFFKDEMENMRIESEIRKSESIKQLIEESIRESQYIESTPEPIEEESSENVYFDSESLVSESSSEIDTYSEMDSQEQLTSLAETERMTDRNIFIFDMDSVLDSEISGKLYDILTEIGFTGIEFKGKNSVGTTNYDFESNEYDFTVTVSDDVYRIFRPNGGGTFYEDGKIKNTVSDLKDKTINYDDMSAYYIMAKSVVEEGLKNPRSAKFPSIVTRPEEISMVKNGNIIGVQSWVDAKNSFGTTVRSKWTVQFRVIDIDTYSYEPVYLNIDGNAIYGEWVDME